MGSKLGIAFALLGLVGCGAPPETKVAVDVTGSVTQAVGAQDNPNQTINGHSHVVVDPRLAPGCTPPITPVGSIQVEPDRSVLVTFNGGVPQHPYEVEATDSLTEPFAPVATLTADAHGSFSFVDVDALELHPIARFYRAVYNCPHPL